VERRFKHFLVCKKRSFSKTSISATPLFPYALDVLESPFIQGAFRLRKLKKKIGWKRRHEKGGEWAPRLNVPSRGIFM